MAWSLPWRCLLLLAPCGLLFTATVSSQAISSTSLSGSSVLISFSTSASTSEPTLSPPISSLSLASTTVTFSASSSGASFSVTSASSISVSSPTNSASTVTASSGFPSSAPVSSSILSVTLSAVSSASSAASVTSVAASSTPISGPPTISGPITIPLSQYTFSAFPTPSLAPVPGVFQHTDPHNPPSVIYDPGAVPDFAPAWATAYKKARAKIATFSLEQKVNVTTGVGWENGLCVGNIPAINPSNGTSWPGLCLEDSPLGVRDADFATAFPAGINAASTFNRKLIRRRGLFMGREHKGKGVNIALGPMMNIGRVAQGGRNWEGYGADPFLSGEAAYETILGMQAGGVQACAKHFINNEQEHARTMESSNVDDRTQHEIYAHPFLRSVMAGVASVMCSYNLVNDTYACDNDKMMNDILKREFGFQGFVMSDWSATHSTLSAVAGLDMTMPGDITFDSGTSYFGGNLTAFVQNGTIPLARLDDMATRILAGWYFLHQDDSSYPVPNFNAFNPIDDATNSRVDVQDEHYKLVRKMGAASTVLLKNVDNALPLKKPRSIVLVGSDAGPGMIGPNEFGDQGGSDGILAMGWGSGTANFTYLISPLEAIQRRARRDRTSVSWFLNDFNLASAGNVVIGKSAAIVFINSDSGEDYITVDGNEGDRKNLTAWHGGDQLILAVAAQNNNTIVVTHSVGPLIVEPWIDHPNVTAVLWAGLPGTEAGNAIKDVLYGDWNPSGRLPYTIAKNASDYPTQLILGGAPTDILSITYTEGLLIDYRWFDAKNITPRFEFGFGLSYTSFKYTNLHIVSITSPDHAQSHLEKAWAVGKASPIGEGSSTALWLHRPFFNVTFDVENTGSVYGGDIPQLYVNHPASAGEPPSILKGFTNVEVLPNEKKQVSITLSRHDLSVWDVVAQGWKKPAGTIRVTVGTSSRDARLHATLPL